MLQPCRISLFLVEKKRRHFTFKAHNATSQRLNGEAMVPWSWCLRLQNRIKKKIQDLDLSDYCTVENEDGSRSVSVHPTNHHIMHILHYSYWVIYVKGALNNFFSYYYYYNGLEARGNKTSVLYTQENRKRKKNPHRSMLSVWVYCTSILHPVGHFIDTPSNTLQSTPKL